MGVAPGTAKTLLKYASRLKPLMLMLYEAFRIAVERKEVPSQEDFVGILDELASSMVNFSALKFFFALTYKDWKCRQEVVLWSYRRRL